MSSLTQGLQSALTFFAALGNQDRHQPSHGHTDQNSRCRQGQAIDKYHEPERHPEEIDFLEGYFEGIETIKDVFASHDEFSKILFPFAFSYEVACECHCVYLILTAPHEDATWHFWGKYRFRECLFNHRVLERLPDSQQTSCFEFHLAHWLVSYCVDHQLILPKLDEWIQKVVESGTMSEQLTKDNNKYVVLLRLICITWESYFQAPNLLEAYVYENQDKRAANLLTLTQTSAEARCALGFSFVSWSQLADVFRVGIVALMQSSFPQANPLSSTVNGSSFALISANFASLIKNIDRLNDLCIIARNMLATKELAQDLATKAKFENQVLMLIDTCVRVTARGCDGPIDGGDRQSQERWQKVVAAYKKLLITCLQFLHNFIMHNEGRKFSLWMDLFGHAVTADPLAVESAMEHLRKRTLENDGLPNGADDVDEGKLGRDFEEMAWELAKVGLSDDLADDKPVAVSSKPAPVITEAQVAKMEELNRRMGSHKMNSDDATLTSENIATITEVTEQVSNLSKNAQTRSIEDITICPASQAADALENAKSRLMERIRNHPQMHLGEEEQEEQEGDTEYSERGDDDPETAVSEAGADDGEEEDEDDDDEEEEEEDEEGEDGVYRGPGDQERGLLTDIPLVLAPSEIEALPMILQAGIVTQFGDPVMQHSRCNILLAQESGRNLLRELLIFIAAWDLPDDEFYFRLMQQIMQAILDNGLMPLAFTTFGEVKDIISPAQAVILKILTQIFRNKHSAQTQASAFDQSGASSSSAVPPQNKPSRFDATIIKFVFSVFRQTVIPQTCALIFLQGQIHKGVASPEDFPLNLWDMERVYEGVYQFLEFFAVLAEDPAWKKLLVEWEIVHELVTLLKELDAGIPKVGLDKAPRNQPPATSAQKNSPQSAPVLVERPYDPATNETDGPTDETPDGEDDDGQGLLCAENPEDFEWRNLKKLVVLVLSSLVWKSTTVQNQVRLCKGVEAVLSCCALDGNNPFIREHAIMCLRFLLEGNAENQRIVRDLEAQQVVPSEVLDKQGYETYIDVTGKVGLRPKDVSGGSTARSSR